MQFPYWLVKIVKKRELAMCKEIRAGHLARAFPAGQAKTHSWHLFLSSKSLDSYRLIQEGVNPESEGYSIQLCDKENKRQGLFWIVMKKERDRDQTMSKNFVFRKQLKRCSYWGSKSFRDSTKGFDPISSDYPTLVFPQLFYLPFRVSATTPFVMYAEIYNAVAAPAAAAAATSSLEDIGDNGKSDYR
ncbi:hypothetical protein V1478_010413 [Vespula squamosa]|uniref:Uncharacterized protein n=1 Tax=Vespula squamosa TaxID=30214 RepID=A0ABD2AHQ4_VESSQ